MFLIWLSETQSFNLLYSVSFSFLFFDQNLSHRKTVNIKLLPANSLLYDSTGLLTRVIGLSFSCTHAHCSSKKKNVFVDQNMEVEITESVITFSRCDKIDLPIKKSQLHHRRNYFSLF